MFPFLSNHGILGINARNLLFVKPFNPKKAIAIADDKLKTKAYLGSRGIPVAKIYGRIDTREELKEFDMGKLPEEFVLKPNRGFGGEGIVVIKGRDKNNNFLKMDGSAVSRKEISEHIEDILDGRYAIDGRPDAAFFEQILHPHSCFARFRPAGLPDVRVIVFNLVPVMAMLRIPTAESDGKANVHLGGIGVGVDIARGATTHGAQFHHIIETLPHGERVSGHKLPFWEDILLIASRAQKLTNLGYLAADITIDADSGPMLLEVNARAGLMVQVANRAPLRSRLERVQGVKVSSPEKGVKMGQDLFGTTHGAQKEEKADERPILGTEEMIEISCQGASLEAPSLIAPNHERTTFTKDLIADLIEKGGAETEEETEGSYRVKFILQGKKLQTVVQVGEVRPPNRAIVGRRDLSGFLIDPTKKTKVVRRPTMKVNLQHIDRTLASIDRELPLLKFLKPQNLMVERELLRENPAYNPVFTYPELPFNTGEARSRLETPVKDETPLGILLEKKRRELLLRLDLLEHRGDNERFTQCSHALYGIPSPELLTRARADLESRIACDLPPPTSQMIDAEGLLLVLQETLEKYGLHEWKVVIRERLVADCTIGGQTVSIRRGARFSPIHVQALIAHEIETHVLTAENGAHQPWQLLRRGCANYLETQEGLAIMNQSPVLTPFHEKRYGAARSALAVALALDHSFAETRSTLEETLGYEPQKALSKTIDVKRGMSDTAAPGGFTKGLVYLRGFTAMERYCESGGDLRRLYVGKVALEDLELVEAIPGLEPPLLLPLWLREGNRSLASQGSTR